VIDNPRILLDKTGALCVHALSLLLHYVLALKEARILLNWAYRSTPIIHQSSPKQLKSSFANLSPLDSSPLDSSGSKDNRPSARIRLSGIHALNISMNCLNRLCSF
jgi:hypothetical protein